MDTVNFNRKLQNQTQICQVNQKTLTQIGLSHEELTLTKKCKNFIIDYTDINCYSYIQLIQVLKCKKIKKTSNNKSTFDKKTTITNVASTAAMFHKKSYKKFNKKTIHFAPWLKLPGTLYGIQTELTSSVLYTVLQYKWLRYNAFTLTVLILSSVVESVQSGLLLTRSVLHYQKFLLSVLVLVQRSLLEKVLPVLVKNVLNEEVLADLDQIHQIVVLCDLNFLLFHSHNPLNLSCFYPLHFLPLHSHCNYLYPYCSDHYHFQLDGKVSSASSILVFSFDTIAERDFLLLLLLLFDFVSSNLMLVVEEFAGFKPIKQKTWHKLHVVHNTVEPSKPNIFKTDNFHWLRLGYFTNVCFHRLCFNSVYKSLLLRKVFSLLVGVLFPMFTFNSVSTSFQFCKGSVTTSFLFIQAFKLFSVKLFSLMMMRIHCEISYWSDLSYEIRKLKVWLHGCAKYENKHKITKQCTYIIYKNISIPFSDHLIKEVLGHLSESEDVPHNSVGLKMAYHKFCTCTCHFQHEKPYDTEDFLPMKMSSYKRHIQKA
ncbi:hypothetical protein KUTeg_002162 [Tegillarca granosa]|uniref:Uncharacterized protein n=1 Tax=Tegillarca granosa TaxID=220873 RepID=A0ABQ9FWB8_TEGGR|nr:hypothetical protein KUTeg_002162 [Tegillarca granosa]